MTYIATIFFSIALWELYKRNRNIDSEKSRVIKKLLEFKCLEDGRYLIGFLDWFVVKTETLAIDFGLTWRIVSGVEFRFRDRFASLDAKDPKLWKLANKELSKEIKKFKQKKIKQKEEAQKKINAALA